MLHIVVLPHLVALLGPQQPLQPRTSSAAKSSVAATMSAERPSRALEMASMLDPRLDRRSSLLGLACLSPGLVFPTPASAIVDEGVRLKYFPGAKSSSAIDAAVWKSLSARGYNKDNTLFGMSVCSDEVNFVENEVIDLMKKRWGESFSLGGLAGVPFAGKAGLSAYAHHVPDEGKLLILFAPHVGVGGDGKVGALERPGIADTSSACGAAVGAFKTLTKAGATPPSTVSDLADLQFEYIKLKLASKLKGVDESANDLAFVTYQMYAIVAEAMVAQILAVPGIWDDCSELALLGGVQINRFGNRDAFQPLMFQTTTQSGKMTDLYPSTFGDMPKIGSILGSSIVADSVLRASL